MKTERRHELKNHALGDWLVKEYTKLKPFLGILIGGLLAVVFLLVFMNIRAGRSLAEAESNWAGLFLAIESDDPEVVATFVKSKAGATVGAYGQLALADAHLESAAQDYTRDTDKSNKHFRSALDNYDAATASKDREIRNRALLGAGKSAEWLLKLEEAKGFYDQVSGPLTSIAERRLKSLGSLQTNEFYAMYEKREPIVPLATPPAGSQLPFGILPESPLDPLTVPGPINLGPGTDTTPETADTPPAEETPTEETPTEKTTEEETTEETATDVSPPSASDSAPSDS